MSEGSQELSVLPSLPLPPTWATRELPILAVALRRMDAGEYFVDLEGLRQELGLPVDQMRLGVTALAEAWPPYLSVSSTSGGPDQIGGFVDQISERARRELGTWPSPDGVLERLVAALEQAAAGEPRSDRKRRLRVAAEALGGVAREVVVNVLSAQLGSQVGKAL